LVMGGKPSFGCRKKEKGGGKLLIARGQEVGKSQNLKSTRPLGAKNRKEGA